MANTRTEGFAEGFSYCVLKRQLRFVDQAEFRPSTRDTETTDAVQQGAGSALLDPESRWSLFTIKSHPCNYYCGNECYVFKF